VLLDHQLLPHALQRARREYIVRTIPRGQQILSIDTLHLVQIHFILDPLEVVARPQRRQEAGEGISIRDGTGVAIVVAIDICGVGTGVRRTTTVVRISIVSSTWGHLHSILHRWDDFTAGFEWRLHCHRCDITPINPSEEGMVLNMHIGVDTGVHGDLSVRRFRQSVCRVELN